MLPRSVTDRWHGIGDIVGLQFRRGSDVVRAYLQIAKVEIPADLRDFSLGSATALAVAGTGFDEIEDASGDNILEPQQDESLYQIFYGITPSYIRVYRQFPPGIDRGNLFGTRIVGTDAVGYIDGVGSPYRSPSPATEFYTIRGIHPAFNGYHPYGEPASVTVRMNFFVAKYQVDLLGATVSDEEMRRAKVITVGGLSLMQAPQWLRSR